MYFLALFYIYILLSAIPLDNVLDNSFSHSLVSNMHKVNLRIFTFPGIDHGQNGIILIVSDINRMSIYSITFPVSNKNKMIIDIITLSSVRHDQWTKYIF